MRFSATQLGSRDAGGSGEAGAIRGAGGAFGKKEAAAEERYFREVVRMTNECLTFLLL